MGYAYEVRGFGAVKGDETGCEIAVHSKALLNEIHIGNHRGEDVGFAIEKCLLWELSRLWDRGIKTLCTCCGHGKYTARIVVDEKDAQAMRDLGYEEIPPNNGEPMGGSCGLCGVSFRPRESEFICKE